MLQILLESLYGWIGLLFILFGLAAIGWLVIHVEHGRHFSRIKTFLATAMGAVFLGFGVHFILLAFGL